MASSVSRRYTVALGPIKKEFIYVDANDDTALNDVITLLANPFGIAIREISNTDLTTNDSMTKTTTPLAVFSTAAPPGQKQIDVSAMANDKFYEGEVTGF